jgi:hypothetical protein
VVGQRGLVAHEHDAALFVVPPDPFATAGAGDAGSDDKIVSANHFAVEYGQAVCLRQKKVEKRARGATERAVSF